MITLILIFIASCIKAIADTIRVPERFNASIFKSFKGHWFIDPQVSWKNQHYLQWFIYPLLSPISDLWHLLNTIIFGLLFSCILIKQPYLFTMLNLDNFQLTFLTFISYCLIYGIGMELTLKLIIKK